MQKIATHMGEVFDVLCRVGRKSFFFSIKSTNLINVYVTCHRSDRFLFRASYNFTVTQVHVEYLNKRVNT